jgi:replicative superfamily II helicase
MYEVIGTINAEYRKSASHNHYHDHIRYAKIISIEPDGVEDVYDLEVQPADCPYKVENWVGGEGGLLLHNSRSRKFHAEKNYWLQQVGMIIVDESHILCMDRGHPVEAGIMRFAQLNSEARIIFLSATMPNVGELGEWLTNLNGKHTEVIFSTWRPVHLQMHYEEYDPVMYSSYGSLRENYNATQQVKLDRVLEIVMSKPEEKFLIFVHAKGMGRQIIYELKKRYNETALFHNADLDLADRREVENSFRQRVGGLRVMVSTSTLAWGINLPARNVVIAGIHRGLQEVDELDIIQMAGRAGRFGVDDQGHVYLVIPRYSTPHWIDVFSNPRPVTSVIKNHEILAFHALAEVATKNVKNSVSFLDWYKRSLAYQQKFELSQLDSDALFDDLKRMEMLNRKSESPRDDSQITGLGLVSAWMYYSPYDIDRWHKNFNLLIRGYEREDGLTMRPEFDDLTLAWALADIPSNDIGYVPKPISDECADLQWKLRNRNIQCGTTIHCVLAAYKCLKGDDVNGGEINVYIRSIRYDIRRVCQALRMIDHMYARWQRFKTWDTIADRIIYGIPEELCELVRIPGIGAKRAKALWDEGIKSIEDVADDKNKKKLFSVLKVDLGAKVRKEAKRIIEAA